MKDLVIRVAATFTTIVAVRAAQPTDAEVLRAFAISEATYRLERTPQGRKLPGDIIEWWQSFSVRGRPEPLFDVSIALLRRALFSDSKALERLKQVSPESFRSIALPSGRQLIHVCLDSGSGATSFSAIIFDPTTQQELSVSATQRWSEGDLKPVANVREICIPAAKTLEAIVFPK